MYRDSSQGLQMMDYCHGVQGFINYTLFNLRILVEGVLNVYARGVKIKKNSQFKCYNNASLHLLQKGFMEKYMCWYTHTENHMFLTIPW
jgi:hypothetical protein